MSNGETKCPTFLRFLAEVFGGDEELIHFVHKAIGYSLTGDTSEHVMFILHGGGATGKSTFLNVFSELLGGYACTTQVDLFTARERAAQLANARLVGTRFVVADNVPRKKILTDELLDVVTSGKPLIARPLYGAAFEFTPQFKLWLACNHLPRIDGQDHVWRRVRVIPFKVRFGDSPGDSPMDKDLPRKLRAELTGILTWAVQGCILWQKEGLGTYAPANETTASCRDTQDVLGEFLQERCLRERDARVMAKDLHEAYTAWASECGEKPMSQRTFTMLLEERGEFTSVRFHGLKQWKGIGLTASTAGSEVAFLNAGGNK